MYVDKKRLIDHISKEMEELPTGEHHDAVLDSIYRLRSQILRGSFNATAFEVNKFSKIGSQNLEEAVRQLDDYICINEGVLEMLEGFYPMSISDKHDLKRLLTGLAETVVASLNAYFLNVSRDVFCIYKIDLDRSNHWAHEGGVTLYYYNGVDTADEFFPPEQFTNFAHMGVRWSHLMEHPDQYACLRWVERGKFISKLVHLTDDVSNISSYWQNRDVAAEVAIALKCKELVEMHERKGTESSCPHCGHKRHPYLDKCNMLIKYCYNCRRPYIVGCNADTLGVTCENPKKRGAKNGRWNTIEIDGV